MTTGSAEPTLILLASADDNRREALYRILNRTTYKLIQAESAQETLEAFKQHVPMIALVDIDLKDGDQSICAKLRQLPGGYDLMLLALVQDDDASITHALNAGVDDCVTATIPPRLLLRRVHNLVRTYHYHADDNHLEMNEPESPLEAEARYRYLFDSASDAIMIVDMQSGAFLDANRRAVRWLGYSRDELLQLTYREIEAPLASTVSEETVVQELSTSGHFIFEQGYRTKDGTILPMEVSSRIVKYGGKRAILNFVRDIRKRKQMEEAEREQRELAEALRDASAILNSTLELGEVVERLLEQVTRVVPAEAANLMLLEDNNAYIFAHRGYEQLPLPPDWDKRRWRLEDTPNLRWMLASGRPSVIADTRNHTAWIVLEEQDWVRSYIGVPITAEGETIGFLNVDHRLPDTFNENHAENLLAFAHHAGIAIQNARLHEAIKRNVEDLEVRVTQRTVELTQVNKDLKEQINERHRIEEALAEERNLLRTLIDNLPDHIYVKDDQHRILTANRALLRHYGLRSTNEIRGKTDRELVDDATGSRIRASEQRIFETGEPINNEESEARHPLTGEPQFFLGTKIPLRDNQGRIIGLVGIDRDISELRKKEAALKEERNMLRTLVDNLPDEVYIKDADGQFILVNQTMQRRLQKLNADVQPIGATPRNFLPKDDAVKEIEEDRGIVASGKPVFNREMIIGLPSIGPRRMLVTKVPLHDPQQHISGIVGINRDVTELRQAEERLDQIITGASCLLWYAYVEGHDDDFQWDMFVSNEQAAQDFFPVSMKPDDTYVDAWRRSILPQDMAMLNRISGEAIRSGRKGYTDELRFRRADGEIRWLREDVQIRKVADAQYEVVGVCTDITPLKEAEQSLQRSNELLEQRVAERTTELSQANHDLREQISERQRAEQAEREQRVIAEALSDAASALSETLDLDDVLDRILVFAGRVVPPHELAAVVLIEHDSYVRTIRQRWQYGEDFVTSSRARRYPIDGIPILREAYDTRSPVTVYDTTSDPRWVLVEHSEWIRSYISVPIQIKGNVIGFLNLGSNQIGQFTPDHASRLLAFSNQAGIAIQNAQLFETIRLHAVELQIRVKERTAQLEHERAQLHAIMDAMTEGVIFYDSQGQARYINESLTWLTGYTQNEWVAHPQLWMSVLYAEDAADSEKWEARVRESVRRAGYWSGEGQIRQKNGHIIDVHMTVAMVRHPDDGTTGFVTVVRDVSAEKRLEAQKARFIATASHELRTPLANLKTRLYLIQRQPDRLQDHMEVLKNVTGRMGKLVDDLFDISRFEHGMISLDPEPMVLQELIKGIVRTQQPDAEAKGIAILCNMPDEPLTMRLDASRMNQVITNLVTNAINYTPEDGEVGVAAATTEDEVVIEVWDTGVGIPSHLLPDVFKPFFRATDSTKGMGLGLSITREIIELHDGEISVESVENEGTCFTVRLPLGGVR